MNAYREVPEGRAAIVQPSWPLQSWLWSFRFIRRWLGGRWERWSWAAVADLPFWGTVWVRVSGGQARCGQRVDGLVLCGRLAVEEHAR